MTPKRKKKIRFEQLDLFTVKLKSAYLLAADSAREAFYRIWIEHGSRGIRVVKESGGKGRVLDRRYWPFEALPDAEKLYEQRIREKTNPTRKSPRKYKLIDQRKDAEI